MQSLSPKEKELLIKMDTQDLTPTQVRLIKSINSLLVHVLTADEEDEYFEFSAQFLKKAAEAIKHGHFAAQNGRMAYGEQAVEFSVDFLNEVLDQRRLDNIDN